MSHTNVIDATSDMSYTIKKRATTIHPAGIMKDAHGEKRRELLRISIDYSWSLFPFPSKFYLVSLWKRDFPALNEKIVIE